jgi:cytochrome P450
MAKAEAGVYAWSQGAGSHGSMAGEAPKPMAEQVPAAPRSAVDDPAEEVFAWFRTMQAEHPVYRDDNGLWHVFAYADVARVLTDPPTFSSDDRAFNPRQVDIDRFSQGSIVNLDPPRHRQLRSLVGQAFTPRVITGLSGRVDRITRELLDRVRGRESFDLVDTLAYPLPVTVIAQLLGIPAQDMPLFRRWAEGLFSIQGVDSSTLPSEELNAQVAPIIREMNSYLLDHIRARRRRPTDDLIGRLTGARVDGIGLQDDEIVGFAGVLLLAGHVTTTALLGNAVLCLDRHPEALAHLRADRALLPAAIEEVLRYRSPFPRLSRVTTCEVQLGDQVIPARRLVMPWIGAANRDPARFVDPERFDIHRQTAGHLAFGHGIHFCIGAPLARLESRIALGILLDRYREIAVDRAATQYNNPWTMVAPRRLPVHVPADVSARAS